MVWLHNLKGVAHRNNCKFIMRKQFVMTDKMSVAIAECPWASRFVKVCDGYQCFESVDDFDTFINQDLTF